MKKMPQDDLITTLVGVDDSFGRCVAICVERHGCKRCVGCESVGSLCEITGSDTSGDTERWRTLDCGVGPTDMRRAATSKAAGDTDGFEEVDWQGGTSKQSG